VPVSEIMLENLREHIAVVTQQVTLFNDTISRNIAYGKLEHASEADIRSAANKAYALDYIEKLESGFDTIVGDDGVLLSGGQRQRLAIARAFLKDAPVLILDEATSALDSESEKYIQAALEEVVKNRTTLIIAHRLSTIEAADLILVMENGCIIEQGTHQELLASQGAYDQLYSHRGLVSDDSHIAPTVEPSRRLPMVSFSSDTELAWQGNSVSLLQNAWYSDARWIYILKPLSYVFQLLASWRRARLQKSSAENWRSPVPVIVVGNISIGGTGKSPLVMWLAENLREGGFRPGIISRGYGGRSSTYPMNVTSTSEPIEVGEEPVMIARRTGCPVVVDPDRTEAAKYLLDNHQCDLLLSDDGLQHYALRRDLEIAVVDASRDLGNGLCFPAGPLREPPARLSEVDFVVINGSRAESSPDYPNQICMDLVPAAWINLHSQQEIPVDAWSKTRQVHGVAGIGNPNRFFDLLRGLGFDVIEHAFEDHRTYIESDLVFADQIPVIMTEKDAIKCRLLNRELMHQDYWYLKVDVEVEQGFYQSLVARLEENYGAAVLTRDN
jgi:tetraacyldisaccharide 4'-kinase